MKTVGTIVLLCVTLVCLTAMTKPTTPPEGAVTVVAGQSTVVDCGTSRLVSSSATYYAKNGKELADVVIPTYSTNEFGENVSATYVAPKKATYVFTTQECGPASVVFENTYTVLFLHGMYVTIAHCPTGTDVDRAESWVVAQGNPPIYATQFPYNLNGYIIFDIGVVDDAIGPVVYANNPSQYVNFDLTLSYHILCRPTS